MPSVSACGALQRMKSRTLREVADGPWGPDCGERERRADWDGTRRLDNSRAHRRLACIPGAAWNGRAAHISTTHDTADGRWHNSQGIARIVCTHGDEGIATNDVSRVRRVGTRTPRAKWTGRRNSHGEIGRRNRGRGHVKRTVVARRNRQVWLRRVVPPRSQQTRFSLGLRLGGRLGR